MTSKPQFGEASPAERSALGRRVKRMVQWLNQGQWDKCHAMIDPKLQAKVAWAEYAESLRAFREAYGQVHPWHVRISLHLDASRNKHDDRPFAYVYIVWQDDKHAFHLFRERWVKNGDRWYSRVAGLVVNAAASA